MAHWFHRNPLKATAKQEFDVKMVATDVEAIKICRSGRKRKMIPLYAFTSLFISNNSIIPFVSDLKQSRARVLELLPDPHHSPDQVDTAAKLYLALIKGFLEVPVDEGGSSRASKLRHALRFRWTNSLLGTTPEAAHDAAYETASVVMNVAFWHMKHAAMIAAKDE